MDVQIKKLPKSEVELTITVPFDVYKKWEKKALEEINKEINIPGFRSGHIPEDILRQNVQEAAIKMATLDYVIPQTYSEAVREKNLPVIAQPKADIKTDIVKEGDSFVYTATVAVLPEVKMGNYKKIKIKRKEAKVADKQIDDTLAMIMNRYAEWKPADRPAQKGDRATLDFEGFEPEVKEGEAPKPLPNTSSKNHPVILGDSSMVPGFESAVMGMKKGETKEFEITFPKDYHAKDMQGKKVKFKTTLQNLEEKMEQKLDEALVQKITGAPQTVEEFKKRIEEDLLAEIKSANTAEHEGAVIGEIVKMTEIDLPEVLVEEELAYMLDEQKKRVGHYGLTWEQFLSHIKKTEEDFKKERRTDAIDRLKARFGTQYIMRDAKIEVSEDEVKTRVEEIAVKIPEAEKKEFSQHYEPGKEGWRHLKNSMTVDKLIEMMTG